MSYEGYNQRLCAKGHLRTFDAYDDYADDNGDPKATRVCSCGSQFVYLNPVDQTNGDVLDDPSTLPYPFEVEEEAETAVCNLGHTHVVKEARYKIPSRGRR